MLRKATATEKPEGTSGAADQVICHWFDTQQGRWRDDLTSEAYCINQLHGNPQQPVPAVEASDIPEAFRR
jgi:hypothetical protein